MGQLWDWWGMMISLVSYRVLVTIWYMPSFHMAWREVWLYNPNKFFKIKLKDVFYLLKHKAQKIFSCLVYTTHFILVLMQICILPLKVCVFGGWGVQTPMKTSSPCDPASRDASVAVSSKFCIQNNFKAATWDGPPHILLQPGLQINPGLSHCTKTGQQMLLLVFTGLHHYLNSLRIP